MVAFEPPVLDSLSKSMPHNVYTTSIVSVSEMVPDPRPKYMHEALIPGRVIVLYRDGEDNMPRAITVPHGASPFLGKISRMDIAGYEEVLGSFLY